MKNRWIIIAAVVAALSALIFFGVNPRQPQYQGKILAEWILRAQQIESTSPDVKHLSDLPEWTECQVALRAMKDQSLPFLEAWIQASDTHPKLWLRQWTRRLGRFGLASRPDESLRLHQMALTGFHLLGTDAQPSYTVLEKMMKDADIGQRFWAFNAFSVIQPPKEIFFPILEQSIADPYPEIKERAEHYIFELYPEEAERLKIHPRLPLHKLPRK